MTIVEKWIKKWNLQVILIYAPHEKFPNMEFFWSLISYIRTEHGDLKSQLMLKYFAVESDVRSVSPNLYQALLDRVHLFSWYNFFYNV